MIRPYITILFFEILPYGLIRYLIKIAHFGMNYQFYALILRKVGTKYVDSYVPVVMCYLTPSNTMRFSS